MYSNCPECGEGLVADVDLWAVRVPLQSDGFVVDEGSYKETEIIRTHCCHCGWSEEGSHYYHTGEVEEAN